MNLHTGGVGYTKSELFSPEKEALMKTLAGLNIPQRQDSTTDQLRDLVVYANLLGCYDAADVVKRFLDGD